MANSHGTAKAITQGQQSILRATLIMTVLLFGGNAQAQETGEHFLAIRLAPGTSWHQEIAVTSHNDPLYPDAVETVTTTYRNTIQPAAGGYRVTRKAGKRTAVKTGGDPELDALSRKFGDSYAVKMEATLRHIDYRADATLKPQEIINWTAIARRQQTLTEKILGKDMANELDRDRDSDPLNAVLPTERLMAMLRAEPLKIGQSRSEPGTISGPEGMTLEATHTITLVAWNATSDEAQYSLVTEASPKAGAEALRIYFMRRFYPLHTVDDAEMRKYRDVAVLVADRSKLRNTETCTFMASIATGLVSSGTCTWDMTIENELGGPSESRLLTVKQGL